MIRPNHPFDLINHIAQELPPEAVLEFSTYEYEPQSILDQRNIFQYEASLINEELLERLLSILGPREELAIHSKITLNKKIFHIPMIDFCCKLDTLKESSSVLKNIIPKEINTEISIFDSGNSLHGYGINKIRNKEWLEYMGRLLLLNLPSRLPVVDTRWIGHRLMAGYCSLRLSNNSKKYLKEPTFVDFLYKI
ncbi:primase 1D-like protein [Pseudomonas sp. EpS/L25]|uniref:primase 1D-like protein n=1 Tax=Pseudomonas sp. EpS/L25 TaxID=1749078 RepID=UPI000AA661C7|nr:hypothetical protein [Pseudomonas sp. EpS/L25]